MDLFENLETAANNNIPQFFKKTVELYADGACSVNPGPGGYAYILIYGEKQKIASAGYRKTTNNRMELLGIIDGLKQLKYPCNVNIYTDSQYVANAFNKNWLNKWKRQNWKRQKTEELKNVDLWKELYELSLKHNLKFHWIKGHSENELNKKCDELAVKAYKSENLLVDENFEKEQENNG
ncbi:MAG TPA: ribonuclease HI [bacterium]|nr:ribonuclease HI [bacterium]HPP88532.1 ribonuclease HI [bacterium]